MKLKALQLIFDELDQLKLIIKKSLDWRERERAETILLLAEGVSAKEIAERQGIERRTVYDRLRRWTRDGGFNSLMDAPRSGAPRKLKDEQLVHIEQWAIDEPLTSAQIQARAQEQFGVTVSRSTMATALKSLGLVWKRARYSLKKSAMK